MTLLVKYEVQFCEKKKMKKKTKKMNKEEAEAVVVRTSNKVRNYLNHDVIIFILSELPLKSFKRFECVCKSWSTLIIITIMIIHILEEFLVGHNLK
jgi:hypothetical protein